MTVLAVLLLAWLGGWGCAYFNTFYNAKRIYAEAQETPRARDGTASSSTKDKYDKAIEKCEALIASYPDSKHVDDAILLIGKCLYETGDYSGAIGRLSELDTLSSDPTVKSEGRLYTAKSYLAKDETDQAIPFLQQIVDEDPEKASDETLFFLGTALVRLGNEEQAVKYLEQLAVKYPRSDFRVKADLEVAELYAERGEYDKSLAVYGRLENAILGEPEKIRYLSNLGKVYTDKGDYAEAVAVFRELDSYTVDPVEKAAYLLVKARSYAGLDSLSVAIDTYKTVAASYPRSMFSAEACYRLGGIYQDKLDSLQVAQQEFDKVAGEYAGSPYASDAISKSSALSKLLRLRASLESGGQEDQAPVQFDLAEIELLQFKNYEKALAGYRKVIEDFPDSDLAPRAAYATAYIYDTALGDSTKAVAAYEFVSTRYPYTQQAEFAREALSRLGHSIPEPPPRAEEPKTAAPPKAASDTTSTGGQSKTESDTTSTGGQSKAESDTTSTDEKPKTQEQPKAESDTTSTGEKPKTQDPPGTETHP